MPYITKNLKEKINDINYSPNSLGELNYLYTLAMIKAWKENPRYDTIHWLKASVICPDLNNYVHEIYSKLKYLNIPDISSSVARELAFLEFYRRIGSHYESNKALENGDVYHSSLFNKKGDM